MGRMFWLLTALTVLLVMLGLVEALLHRRNLRAMPIRIHVNGTRGKSSVTRLIAAGLRAGGVSTCAKTTGTLARMILPDGTEYPVFRPARANVVEQLRIVAAARAYDARALVIECMALVPYLQWLSEAKMIRATHAVITNARADHLDVMGPEETDVALALAGMIPRNGVLYTAERRHLAVLESCCRTRGTRLVTVGADDIAAVTQADLEPFSYVEHADNVALALRVCADVGVARDTALAGMWAANPDPGVLCELELDFFGRRIVFVNGFAANDPESTEKIWRLALERHPDVACRLALFNCRADRPDRTRQLAQACVTWPAADHIVLMGTGTYLFAREYLKVARDASNGHFVFVEGRNVDDIFESVVGLAGHSALVMGMGNIGGQGLDLVRYFRNRSVLRRAA